MKIIDHIGIAVPDFSGAEDIFRLLGLESRPPEKVEEQKVETLSFKIGGSEIELLKPTADDSPIAKFLEKKGAGIHHLAIRVENLEKEIDFLLQSGVRMIEVKPRLGAGGKKIVFIHPKSAGGILIELSEICK